MDSFREKAFCLLLWRTILVGAVAIVLIAVGQVPGVSTALIAAHVALLFAIGLMLWADRLSSERIVRSEAWRLLQATERPGGEGGRRLALDCLRGLTLRFAEGASGVAIALSGVALLASAG